MFDTVGGRKFTAVTLVILLTTILVWFAKISDTTFANVVVPAVLGYMGSNVVQKWVHKGEANNVSNNGVGEMVENNPT